MDVLVPRVGELMGGSQREERLGVLEGRMRDAGVAPDSLAWYLDLRRYGSVPHAGFGLGFERLVQYCTGLDNIRDAIAFPRAPGCAGRGGVGFGWGTLCVFLAPVGADAAPPCPPLFRTAQELRLLSARAPLRAPARARVRGGGLHFGQILLRLRRRSRHSGGPAPRAATSDGLLAMGGSIF